VIERHLIALSFGTSFGTIEDVIRARSDTLYQVLWRANTAERFDDSHSSKSYLRRSGGRLLVQTEAFVTFLDEANDLASGSQPSIGVGFGRLCTHLLRRREVAFASSSFELFVCSGADISEVAEVFALLEEGDELRLVDDFLASGVDENCLLGEEGYEFTTDGALRFGGSRDVEGDDVAGREEFLLATESVYTFLLDDFGWGEGVVGVDFHTNPLSDASHVATRIPVGQETELLILELRTGGTIEAVADSEEKHSEDEFADSICILSRGIHHAYAVSGSGLEVYVVVAGTSTDDNLELLSSVEDFSVYNVATDDNRSYIGDSSEELCLRRVLFEEDYFEACFGENLLDTSDCGSSEWLFGGYKNL